MERWLDIWQQVLRADLEATAWGLAGIALLTFFELAGPAERDQSWRGRASNLLFLVQLKVLGTGTLALWFAFCLLYTSPSPRDS